MSKVGNQTNSQDPQAINSRTFVGNLNTFQCTKTDVERMFQRYGRIAGISMHKGYAFVQFTNPFDARSACMGEDGRGVFGQILARDDVKHRFSRRCQPAINTILQNVNLVAEPKPHQIGRKRPNVAKTSGDWEQFYDSYNAGGAMGACGPRLTPPLKRPRLVVPSMRQQPRAQSPKKVAAPGLEDLKTYSSPDILICGNCRELFSNLSDFIDHRRTYCKLRFTCKCSSHNGTEESALLLCALCKENFASAWDLMVHAQAAHMVNIYQLGSKDASQDGSSSIAAEDSAAGNDLTTDATSESNGGEASGEASGGTKEEEEGLSTLPKENGVGGEEEGEGSSEMMNSSPILPQSEMDQGEGERETGMVQ
ncbi:heterogeneous nuclear ribonucleoprotein C-like isoform X5 [Portunus trituberculatus]|uniref:heterogeneous nuclear ribonucleoprotein C-like isoform X5 n=1 Tax=Portunus trituberculatus TaxID=210409 RepID=UPI001E1CE43A|nr:heterogeneous nuclear ribonucleoprotein C-like isoform X5 [Portunus trituberculatus]